MMDPTSNPWAAEIRTLFGLLFRLRYPWHRHTNLPMNRLEEILRVKREEIERLRPRGNELRRAALQRNDFRSFRSALKRADAALAIIAEIKKASPSAGLIVENFD